MKKEGRLEKHCGWLYIKLYVLIDSVFLHWSSSLSLKFRRYLRTFHAYSRRRIHTLVKSQTFYWIVIILVLLNTVVLASEYYGQPQWLTDTQGKRLSSSRDGDRGMLNELRRVLLRNRQSCVCLSILLRNAPENVLPGYHWLFRLEFQSIRLLRGYWIDRWIRSHLLRDHAIIGDLGTALCSPFTRLQSDSVLDSIA